MIANKLKYIIITLVIVISVLGCSDTFGTDPNVKITELNPNISEPKDTIKSPIELIAKWNFIEYFSSGARGSSMTWGTNHKLLRNRFHIDTTGTESVVWLDIEVVCTIPDGAITSRFDRIHSMRLIVDSLTVSSNKIENSIVPQRNKLVRVELVVKDLRSYKKYIINEKELGIIFSIYQESKSRGVRGFLNADLGQFVTFNTFSFQAIFDATYK